MGRHTTGWAPVITVPQFGSFCVSSTGIFFFFQHHIQDIRYLRSRHCEYSFSINVTLLNTD